MNTNTGIATEHSAISRQHSVNQNFRLLRKDTSQIDKLILLAAAQRWLKLARIIADVEMKMGGLDDGSEERLELISSRINHLVKHGSLLSQGNVANWRFSEVRLPASESND